MGTWGNRLWLWLGNAPRFRFRFIALGEDLGWPGFASRRKACLQALFDGSLDTTLFHPEP
jgi:hypothetical protein